MEDKLIELVSLAEQRGYFESTQKKIVYLGSLPYIINEAGIFVEYHEHTHSPTEIVKLLIPSMSKEKLKEFIEEMEIFIKEKENENANKELS